MRILVASLAFVSACTPSPTAQHDVTVASLPSSEDAAPIPYVQTSSVDASVPPPAFDAAPALDMTGLDLVGATTPRALLARLAREGDAIPKGRSNTKPAPDAERDQAIRARFGPRCRLERTCGPLWGVDCEAAADGPYYYVRPTVDGLVEITVCGGACMGGRCTNCPPKNEGWTCTTY